MPVDMRQRVHDILQSVLDDFDRSTSLNKDSDNSTVRIVNYSGRENPFSSEKMDGSVQSVPENTRDGLKKSVHSPKDEELLKALTGSTLARIGVGRAGTRPNTDTLLRFWADHAAAVDAVFGEMDMDLLEELGLFTVTTLVKDKDTYIRRPDLGRRLSLEAIESLKMRCVRQPQVQIVVSDGLSSQAVIENLRDIYPALCQSLQFRGLSLGTPFYVSRGRVAVMDQIGDILSPDVIVLLIGERPGLVAADSMSAYLCYRPCTGTLEADRMVLSNIHRRGTPPIEAGAHLGDIVKKIIEKRASGVKLATLD